MSTDLPQVTATDREWSVALAEVIDVPLCVATLGMALAVAACVWSLGWVVTFGGLGDAAWGTTALFAIGAFYAMSGRSIALARFACSMALSVALAYTCQVATFVIGVTGMPFQSARLTAADRWLGFSWPTWKAWVVRHPLLEQTFQFLYPKHIVVTGVTIAVLALCTTRGAARFLRAFAMSFGVAAIGQVFVPALSCIADAPSNAVRLALRDGSFHALDGTVVLGLISFPSLHAALAVLVFLALWPYRLLRVPLTVGTFLMLVAIPSQGGHYLVDVLAGVAVAGFAYWWAGRTIQKGLMSDYAGPISSDSRGDAATASQVALDCAPAEQSRWRGSTSSTGAHA